MQEKSEKIYIREINHTIEDQPDTCPLCHHGIQPELRHHYVTKTGHSDYAVQAIYLCPRNKCNGLFICVYRVEYSQYGGYISRIAVLRPTNPKTSDIPDEIKELSPRFFEVFSQSEDALSYGLTEIAGGGYRKSLEVLVKDFCISEHPLQEEAILKSMLSKCINDYVGDERIKDCAIRAAWLGNDQLHYKVKFLDKDVEDMKILTKMVVGFVHYVLLAKKYKKSMP